MFLDAVDNFKSKAIEKKVSVFGQGDIIADMALKDAGLLLAFMYSNSYRLKNRDRK